MLNLYNIHNLDDELWSINLFIFLNLILYDIFNNLYWWCLVIIRIIPFRADNLVVFRGPTLSRLIDGMVPIIERHVAWNLILYSTKRGELISADFSLIPVTEGRNRTVSDSWFAFRPRDHSREGIISRLDSDQLLLLIGPGVSTGSVRMVLIMDRVVWFCHCQ